jgi:D-3-phosphoglycerate dehydrogenase / 2-oxoglutarate reductase
MRFKVLLTEVIDKAGTDYLLDHGYEIKMGSGIAESTVINEMEGCDAILTRNAVITEKVMRSSSKLKVISMHGVGVDNIDVDAATRLGIQVTNAAGSNSLSVAEYTMGLILSLARNIPLYDSELRKGNWNIRKTLGFDLEGKTLGIIGMGSIGALVAKKASMGFGMKVLGYKRHNAMEAMDHVQITTDLDQVIRSADFLSLHVPSVPATRNMIGTRELSIMKPNSYLINTARGDVVDNDALFLALRERRLAGAAVDVFVGEVPDMDNPLLHLSNIIVTPHTAAFTKESVERMSLFAAIGVDEVLSGKQPTNPVNTVTLEESDELFTCAS